MTRSSNVFESSQVQQWIEEGIEQQQAHRERIALINTWYDGSQCLEQLRSCKIWDVADKEETDAQEHVDQDPPVFLEVNPHFRSMVDVIGLAVVTRVAMAAKG